ncbi:hypothetical protein TNCV_439291 [Trichonephila clavipes]|nr:hypothetical protein TNCV_439291 [Trichonephila clavipes]
MLLSPSLMTQNGVPANAFSLMVTAKSHTGLNLVNRRDAEVRYCEFWRRTLLLIGIDIIVLCHAEGTSRHSARTKVTYDKWISSNDVKSTHNAAC